MSYEDPQGMSAGIPDAIGPEMLWDELVANGGDVELLLTDDYLLDEQLIDSVYTHGLRLREQGKINTDNEWQAYLSALDQKNRSYL